VKILAHRGANRVARENTLDAFGAAAAMGADGVEFDVRMTADGVLVIHHDAVVDGLGPLGEVAAADLPPWLPSLADALDACADLPLVNVEIKHDGAGGISAIAAAVAAALSARPPPPDGPRLIVSSFDLDVLDAHRAAAPQLATAWLTVLPVAPDDAVALTVGRGHKGLHPHEALVGAELVDAAHDEGLVVGAWTVNEAERAMALVALGVDIVISDAPDILLAAMGR
jgi:glycerophosphoryl diester phosphodiesterase